MQETQKTTIRLPESIVQKIDQVAKMWNCDRNQSIISLLEMALAQESPTPSESATQSLDSANGDSDGPASRSGPE